jgi:hypothetical protein
MARIFVLLLIVVIIAGLVWAQRRQGGGNRLLGRRSGRGDRSAAGTLPGGIEKLRDNPVFWGVEMGQPGCEAAQALLGQQFTFAEVPQLPLEGCSSACCTCQFKGLKDRRVLVRRQQENRREALRFDKDRPPDRRSRKDRRRGNVWIDHDY